MNRTVSPDAVRPPIGWALPPSDLKLFKRDIHVWRVNLEQPESGVREFEKVLSSDERDRAARFYFERDRRRYIVARGVGRTILSRYLGIDPESIRFRYGANGKPSLAECHSERSEESLPSQVEPLPLQLVQGQGDEPGASVILSEAKNLGLSFNVAHSHEIALFAFTPQGEVGVDVEYQRDLPDLAQVAERFFSARENEELQGLPADQQREAFYNCWTRKEAFIKALGDGLTHPLDTFVVTLASGEPARLLQVDGDPQEAGRWRFEALYPGQGYTAALAVRGSTGHLGCWQFYG